MSESEKYTHAEVLDAFYNDPHSADDRVRHKGWLIVEGVIVDWLKAKEIEDEPHKISGIGRRRRR